MACAPKVAQISMRCCTCGTAPALRPRAAASGPRAAAPRRRAIPVAGSLQGGGTGGVVAAASVTAAVPGAQPYPGAAHARGQPKQPQPQPPSGPPRSASGRALSAPARLEASGTASVAVRDAGGDVSLGTYMRLPVEQYYILDPSQVGGCCQRRWRGGRGSGAAIALTNGCRRAAPPSPAARRRLGRAAPPEDPVNTHL